MFVNNEIAIVMDNLKAHKVERVLKLVCERCAGVRFLPTYSPDFNLMEQCWSKTKPRCGKPRQGHTTP